jgi:transcriptional regulator with XRE-family HTH domain
MTIATMRDIDVALAEEVRVMIARRQIKQRAIAEAIGITPMALSRRLSGDVPISAAELLRISEVLDCRLSELLPHLDSNQEPFDYSSNDYRFRCGYALAA